MDPATLATTLVVTFLRPYIEQGAKKVGEAVSEKVGKAAADFAVETASKVWNYIKTAFQSEDEKSVLTQFEKRPKASEELLKEVLTEKLQQDKQLAQELENLVSTHGPDGTSTSAEIMNNAGIAGNVIIQGNISGSSNSIAGVMFRDSAPKAPSSEANDNPNDARVPHD
jgi:hypothetical protein